LGPLIIQLSKEVLMTTIKQSLDELMSADGALCAAVVDSNSGMMLGSIGTGIDLEVAAAGNSEVMRAKNKTMRQLGLNDVIEDMLITLGKQYHLIRPSSRKEGVFIYFVLDRAKSNLALARRKVQDVDKEMMV
jgi:predicted regulator of Ras-like GTPase activity (Roadblock/LC7/MglB family)